MTIQAPSLCHIMLCLVILTEQGTTGVIQKSKNRGDSIKFFEIIHREFYKASCHWGLEML